MARVQAYSADYIESINVVITKDRYPILYRRKIEELVEQKAYETIEDAEIDNPRFEIELELYYDKEWGLYGVESDAISSSAESICSPYTGESMIDFIEK
jgi:hypothetical protein